MAQKSLISLNDLVRCSVSFLGLFSLSIGVRLEYLLPYSPDLNPIEEAFSKIKHFIRRHQAYYSATTDDGIIFDMLEVMEIITSDDAAGYFAHAGYF